MEVINIITTERGIISDIKSYGILDKDLEDEVVEQVNDRFEKIVTDYIQPLSLEELDTDIEEILDNGYFEYNGVEIQIAWSYIENVQI